MNRNQRIATILLGVWLLLANAVPLLRINVPELELVLTLLGLTAGVALLLGWYHRRERGKGRRAAGMLLLGFWLIVRSLLPLLHLNVAALDIALALLAMVAGVLILLD
jgi:hypothetical protein